MNNIKLYPTEVSALTSDIPAHRLLGNDMSDYLE